MDCNDTHGYMCKYTEGTEHGTLSQSGLNLHSQFNVLADPGFSGGGAGDNHKGGTNLLFGKIFAEN